MPAVWEHEPSEERPVTRMPPGLPRKRSAGTQEMSRGQCEEGADAITATPSMSSRQGGDSLNAEN
jgi:hypothetical protein